MDRLRTGDASQRLTAIPGWPYSAVAVLGFAASSEALVRGQNTGYMLLAALLVALASTAPVAWVAGHRAAPVAITGAVVAALLMDGRLTVAGLIAVAVTFLVVGRVHSSRFAGLLLVPLIVLAIAGLSVGSGPATSDVEVRTDTGSNVPVDEPAAESDDGVEVYPLLVVALAVGAAGIGHVRRARATEERLERREASFADVALAHSAQGERVRIARELHDVVAHRITSIAVQAETTRLTTPDLPPEGAKRLEEIGESARDALTEMRRLLGVLRKDDEAGPDRGPQPGIAQLGELIDDARRLSDASVRLIVSGPVTALDPGIELTVYRIVQEALTNTRRHAPGAAVDVELEYGAGTLRVAVRDTGGKCQGEGSEDGHGLVGMRERVEMVGGELNSGRSESGGFTVAATLPGAAGRRTSPAAADG